MWVTIKFLKFYHRSLTPSVRITSLLLYQIYVAAYNHSPEYQINSY